MITLHSLQPNKGRYLAYLRVSPPKQGEGVSLLTQRETIAAFAARTELLVTGWYEERETAAKQGRRIFAEASGSSAPARADGSWSSGSTAALGALVR